MIYIKIFSAYIFLYCLKHKLKLLLGFIILIFINILLIDSEQNYQNISNINKKINNKLDGQYVNFNENFIIKSKDKKTQTLFVGEEINEHLFFNNMKKYNISYSNEPMNVFEIDFINKNNKIFIKNLYESYLNNDKQHDYSFLEDDYFINYLSHKNLNNLTLNDVFYKSLIIMNNSKNNDNLLHIINYLNKSEIICDKYDILINVKLNNTRISVLCNK